MSIRLINNDPHSYVATYYTNWWVENWAHNNLNIMKNVHRLIYFSGRACQYKFYNYIFVNYRCIIALNYTRYIPGTVHTVHFRHGTYGTFQARYIRYISGTVHTVHSRHGTYGIFQASTYGIFQARFIRCILSTLHTVHWRHGTYGTLEALYIRYIPGAVRTDIFGQCTHGIFVS